jgi:hypothetical protein
MQRQKPFFKTTVYVLALLLVGFLFLPCEIFPKDTKKETEFFHRVLRGESLSRIARQYLPLTEALSVDYLIEKIKELNGIQGSLIRPNQRLMIPLVPSTPVAAKNVPKQIDFEARGIYVNRFSMGCRKMRRLLDRLITFGGNTVILDAKDMSGRLFYPSKVPLAKEIGAISSPIIGNPAKLFHYLHKMGLHVGVRLVLFYDPLLATKRPELALRSTRSGDPCIEKGEVAWVDPYQSAVQSYNLDIAKELAEMGVDEIQFDYMRFPTMECTRETTYGLEERKIPKHQIITDFLARAHKALTPYKILLSIDVFGIIAWGRPEDTQMIGQKIEDLVQHCDVICPMIYPSHFYGPFQDMANPGAQPFLVVSETCRRFSSFLKNSEVTLRPWVQAFPFGTKSFNEKYIHEELRALAQSKARGWLFWSAGNAYDHAWKALALWNNTVA